ncbi:AzlC family protein [Pseudodesulfovibrio profundus]|uniref:AzlC family protein n=1 Tax=Pseudodesulfovibrio profundus TaxID=57320 RepID=A0A2C8FBF1_9BACT|nr:AzlC family ABC transporter permease [Pseudodesulfovibrio profundus]SOB59371.1 AzlC family protein [Pseudodesulfovibrio profundus]
MDTTRSAFILGMREVSPMLLGVLPFGVICGAVCSGVGMPEWSAAGMSVIIFAGASQLAAIQLMTENASLPVVILTGLIINARFLMYSVSIASHFNGIGAGRKCILSYFLTDQSYAISMNRFAVAEYSQRLKVAYYMGNACIMWVAFNATTVLGAYLGAIIPPEWNLDFAVPLTFTALVIPAVKDRPALLAAVVSGVVAYFADPLPYNLGLITAAVCGIVVGYVAEGRKSNG